MALSSDQGGNRCVECQHSFGDQEKVWSWQERKIIELIRSNTSYNASDIAKELGVTRKTINNQMKTLKEKGIVVRIGADKNGHWEVKISINFKLRAYVIKFTFVLGFFFFIKQLLIKEEIFDFFNKMVSPFVKQFM